MMLAAFRRFLSPLLDTRPPEDLVWITTELAQSEQFAPRQAAALRRLAIGSVLDLRTEQGQRLAPLAKAGLHYLHLPIADGATPTEEELARAADWVRQELGDDRKVLVHCRLDTGHTATVVAAVLLRTGYPPAEAAALIRRNDPDAILGDTQLAILQRYADSLRP